MASPVITLSTLSDACAAITKSAGKRFGKPPPERRRGTADAAKLVAANCHTCAPRSKSTAIFISLSNVSTRRGLPVGMAESSTNTSALTASAPSARACDNWAATVGAEGPPDQKRDRIFVSRAVLIRSLHRFAYRQSRLLFPLPRRERGPRLQCTFRMG